MGKHYSFANNRRITFRRHRRMICLCERHVENLEHGQQQITLAVTTIPFMLHSVLVSFSFAQPLSPV
jgi:hypothetical protein